MEKPRPEPGADANYRYPKVPTSTKAWGSGAVPTNISSPVTKPVKEENAAPVGLSTPGVENHTPEPSVPTSLRTRSLSSPLLLPPQRVWAPPDLGPSGETVTPTGPQGWRGVFQTKACPTDRPQRQAAPHSWNFPAHSFSLSHVASGEFIPIFNSKKNLFTCPICV